MSGGGWVVAGLAVSLVAAGGALALAWAHLRRVRERPSADVDRLLGVLRAVPVGGRARLAKDGARAGTWEAELADEVARAPSGDAIVVEVDAALAELEGGLVAARGWSAAALRVALLGGLLGAAMVAADGRLLLALGAAVVGGTGASAAAALGRRAAAAEVAQRRRADDLVTMLLGGRTGGPPSGRPAQGRAVLDRPRRAG